jgi:hypothetical protein
MECMLAQAPRLEPVPFSYDDRLNHLAWIGWECRQAASEIVNGMVLPNPNFHLAIDFVNGI